MFYGNSRKAERERQRKQAAELAEAAVLAAVHSGLRLARERAKTPGPVIPRQRREEDTPPERGGPSG